MLWRVGVSYHPHSGLAHPESNFGDFEAQRHWMEITLHLSPLDWYRNTTDNDLSYWGLDYPPLTAYHSWLNGQLARLLYPPVVEWKSSRGLETWQAILFMRATVLLVDLVVLLPSLWLFVMRATEARGGRNSGSGSGSGKWRLSLLGGHGSHAVLLAVVILMLQPANILVDNGHFQLRIS